jgi:hypothetical protein
MKGGARGPADLAPRLGMARSAAVRRRAVAQGRRSDPGVSRVRRCHTARSTSRPLSTDAARASKAASARSRRAGRRERWPAWLAAGWPRGRGAGACRRQCLFAAGPPAREPFARPSSSSRLKTSLVAGVALSGAPSDQARQGCAERLQNARLEARTVGSGETPFRRATRVPVEPPDLGYRACPRRSAQVRRAPLARPER